MNSFVRHYAETVILWLGLFGCTWIMLRLLLAVFFDFDILLWLNFQLFRLKVWRKPERLNSSLIRVLARNERDYALRIFGYGRYIDESETYMLDHDQTFGDLYRFSIANDTYVILKVTNSTPEPNGSYTIHYIRVPNQIRTAHSAVAWTFHQLPYDYHPDIET